MGMYDVVNCEVPLPDGLPDDGFQTKDMDCELDEYAIQKDGQLVRGQPGEAPSPTDYTGDVLFYGGATGQWRQFLAKFVDGRLMLLKIYPEPDGS